MLKGQRKANGVQKKIEGGFLESTAGAVSLDLGLTTPGCPVSAVECQACLGAVMGGKFSLLPRFSSKDFALVNGQYCFLPLLIG